MISKALTFYDPDLFVVSRSSQACINKLVNSGMRESRTNDGIDFSSFDSCRSNACKNGRCELDKRSGRRSVAPSASPFLSLLWFWIRSSCQSPPAAGAYIMAAHSANVSTWQSVDGAQGLGAPALFAMMTLHGMFPRACSGRTQYLC
jgi:hypothetical protein